MCHVWGCPRVLCILPYCSEAEEYSILEGREVWEIWAVPQAPVSPAMNVTLFQSSHLGISWSREIHLERLPGTSRWGRHCQADNMTIKRAEEGWQHGMGMWEGWDRLPGGVLQLWVPEFCMGQHRNFLTLTLAGMIGAQQMPRCGMTTSRGHRGQSGKASLGAAVAGAWTQSEINGCDTDKC